MVVTEVWIVNRLSSYGEEIKNLEQIEAKLVLENRILENQIAKTGSLKLVEAQAESLGFLSIKNLLYIKE